MSFHVRGGVFSLFHVPDKFISFSRWHSGPPFVVIWRFRAPLYFLFSQYTFGMEMGLIFFVSESVMTVIIPNSTRLNIVEAVATHHASCIILHVGADR